MNPFTRLNVRAGHPVWPSAILDRDGTLGHFTDADAWRQTTQRFHDLILERVGNRTLSIRAGVLREVVAMHLSTAVMRTFDRPGTQDQFRQLIDLFDGRRGRALRGRHSSVVRQAITPSSRAGN